MSTPLKRLTSRLNSRKSTGPRSITGKQTVSQNAVRHGMFANSVILQGESETRFIQMVENFNEELQPQSETEQALVDMMATARWRQMRVWGIERATLTQEMLDQVALLSVTHPGAEEHMDLPARAALAFRHLADNSRSLQMINRYEATQSRQFFRALQQLMALRETENDETKPNIDLSEQNQQPGLLINDQQTQPASDPAPSQVEQNPSPAPDAPRPATR
jgi:hypothetical protein